jgi:hypothetical protein
MTTMILSFLAAMTGAAGESTTQPAGGQGQAQLVEARKIWDKAPHNAFTDLIRFKDRWLCTFREGTGHVSHDGKIRVIASPDGREWSSAALLAAPGPLPDLRDPKVTVTPDGRLMLTAVAASRKATTSSHQTYAWLSADASDWGQAVAIGEPDVWLWRVAWRDGTAYGVGYDTLGGRFVRLYASRDGRKFDVLVERLTEKGSPSEAALAFTADGTALCLLRRDGQPNSALLGTAKAPYRQWTWHDLARPLGGPALIPLADSRFLAAGRLYDGKVRTSLLWLDPQAASLRELLPLPSGGDTSYPGLVVHDGALWVSYYSSHEAKTSIYLAKVALPAKAAAQDATTSPTAARP